MRALQQAGKVVPSAMVLELLAKAIRGDPGPHVLSEWPRSALQVPPPRAPCPAAPRRAAPPLLAPSPLPIMIVPLLITPLVAPDS